jgi:hypothetical protein
MEIKMFSMVCKVIASPKKKHTSPHIKNYEAITPICFGLDVNGIPAAIDFSRAFARKRP